MGRAKRTRGETGEDEIEGPLGRGGDRCGLGGTERGPVRKGFLRSHVRHRGGLLLAVSDAVQGGSLERMLSYPEVGPLGVCCVVGASASVYVRKQGVRTLERSAASTFRRLYLLSGSRAYL